jgi:hypothetical protein
MRLSIAIVNCQQFSLSLTLDVLAALMHVPTFATWEVMMAGKNDQQLKAVKQFGDLLLKEQQEKLLPYEKVQFSLFSNFNKK